MEIRELQRYRCGNCGSEERLHVHHRHGYANVRNELPSDLIALCEKCHRCKHPGWV